MPLHDTPDSIPTKQCSKCREWKPATNEYFAQNNTAKDGLRSQCKTCVNAAYDPAKVAEYGRRERTEKPDRIRQRKRQEYQRNRARYLEQMRKHREENRDEINRKKRETHRDRYRNDPEYRAHFLELSRQWHRDHPDVKKHYYAVNATKIKQRVKAWIRANREIARARSRQTAAAYRIRKSLADGAYTTKDIERIYNEQDGKCKYCGVDLGTNFQTDHVVPLSRGGSNDPINIAITCPTCNQSKGNKLLDEWRGR